MCKRDQFIMDLPHWRSLVATLALACATFVAPVTAGDHRDAPGLGNNPQSDIADLYAFQSPANPANTVFIMTVNPLAGVVSPTGFDPATLYEFAIDQDGDFLEDRTIGFTFSPPDPNGVQNMNVIGNVTTGLGVTRDNLTLNNGGVATAGVFDDPFFFDRDAFHEQHPFCEAPGGPPGASGEDFFAGFDVNAIVIEIPSATLGSGEIGVWARTIVGGQQVDRMGGPFVNTLGIPAELRDAFNQGQPIDDPANFGVLPDILTLDPGDPTGYPNGWQLTDDVTTADLIGQILDDCVDANDRAFLETFPYLAEPHRGGSKPVGGCVPPEFALQFGQPVTDLNACVDGILEPGEPHTATLTPGDCTRITLEHILAYLLKVEEGQTGILEFNTSFVGGIGIVYGPECEEVTRTTVQPGVPSLLTLPPGNYLAGFTSDLPSFPETFDLELTVTDVPLETGACCIDAETCRDLATPAGFIEKACNFEVGDFKGLGTDCTTDTDGDGIPDVRESNDPFGGTTDPCNLCTDPGNPDSNGNGVNDGDELAMGMDPCSFTPSGACCIPGNVFGQPVLRCDIRFESDCFAQGGFYKGDGTECTEGICNESTGPEFNGSCLTFLDTLAPGQPGQCASAGFGIDPIVDEFFDLNVLEKGSTGRFDAEFDGFGLFDPDEPNLAPPDNLLDPFFASVDVEIDGPGNDVNTFRITHRGSVSFAAADVDFQGASFDTASRVVFTPQSTDPNTDTVDISINISHSFRLIDDLPGDNTRGASFAGSTVRLLEDDGLIPPVFEFEDFAALDFDLNDAPDVFSGFESDVSIESCDCEIVGGSCCRDIKVTKTKTVAAKVGDELSIDSDTFASIFADGFESGDVSVWSSSSPDSLVIAVSSPDPNVTFAIAGAPVTITCCLPGNDCQALLAGDCATRGGAEVASCDACLPCVDDDGDGVTTCDGDCDDTDPAILPGADEVCDDRDNNCNGLVDEQLIGCEVCEEDDDECEDGDPTTRDTCEDGLCFHRTPFDFAAIGVDIEEVSPGIVNITPIISVTSPGTRSFPLEVDILVDGMIVAQNALFNVGVSAPANRCDDSVACDGVCRVRLTRGEDSQRFDGGCNALPGGDCACSANFDLPPANDIVVSAGSVVTLVMDPENTVAEFDETNNVFTQTIGTSLPAPALDGSDTFISPFGESCPLTMFNFNATEPLAVNVANVTVTGGSAAPNATVEDLGDGAHKVTLDAAAPPGEWVRIDMAVTGKNSGRDATLIVFAAQQPLDIDGDMCTNIRDATSFGQVFGSPSDRERADLNCDGRVDPRDATTFGNNWFGRAPAARVWGNTCLPDKP